jgi:AcrR family transcriptional regulator
MTTVSKRKELVDNLVKAEIVKTVLALIKQGQPVTMDEIARRCSVAKGTLYNYFKDKKALMHYVHQTVLGPIRDTNTAIFESTKDPILRLHEFIDSAFGIHEDVSLYFQFVQQKRTVANQIDERFELVMGQLITFCDQGIREGYFIDVDPIVLAEMIYGTVIGSLISIQEKSGTPDMKKIDMKKIKQDTICLVDKIILPSRRKK